MWLVRLNSVFQKNVVIKVNSWLNTSDHLTPVWQICKKKKRNQMRKGGNTLSWQCIQLKKKSYKDGIKNQAKVMTFTCSAHCSRLDHSSLYEHGYENILWVAMYVMRRYSTHSEVEDARGVIIVQFGFGVFITKIKIV